MRGNLRNPARRTWSFELFLNRLRSGHTPPDFMDYPYYVVREFMHLEEQYPVVAQEVERSQKLERADGRAE